MQTCKKHSSYKGFYKPKVNCKTCKAIYENNISQIQTLIAENRILKRQVSDLSRTKSVDSHQFQTKSIIIGYVTDTHMGSLYERTKLIKVAYQCFQDEGITKVYHSGDLVDGEKMYRGQEYELKIHGADAQVSHFVNSFPEVSGIKTYFITGNHDLSFYKHSGVDVGFMISSQRSDLVYLRQEEADIPIQNKEGKIILRLSHPGKGTAYALSYHPQKYMESLTGGEKPNIIFCGHYHKSEYLFYRNIHFVQGGTLQAQTPFMRRQHIAAMLGFWTIRFQIYRNSVVGFTPTFHPFFK